MLSAELILLIIAAFLWLLGLFISVLNFKALMRSVRMCYALGCACLLVATGMWLMTGDVVLNLVIHLIGEPVQFHLSTAALWLMLFGLITTIFVCVIGTTSKADNAQRYWCIGLGLSLFGALGVFALQDMASFLISWELLSLGGVVMVLAERIGTETDRSAYLMLALLEAGAVAILLAMLALSLASGGLEFNGFVAGAKLLPGTAQFFIGILFLLGFGAKLGILPYYEWFPGAYGHASGSTGALFSGLILNAAFFALMRSLIVWLPADTASLALGIFVCVIAVVSAILSILYAFQQTDWRRLLSLSSAENASIAVLLVGTAVLFRQQGLISFAVMATVVSLLHMAAHTLAKCTMFFMADGVFAATRSYTIKQVGLLKHFSLWGLGILFAAMSLSAMPPQSGFLSEWYAFQTFFHGIYASNLSVRITLVFMGAGLALSSAIALASYVKVFGISLLGVPSKDLLPIPYLHKVTVTIIGILVLALAVGMTWWIQVLVPMGEQWFASGAVKQMVSGWLMIPLSKHFAFSSPLLLIIVMPLFAVIPLLFLSRFLRFPIRREKVWFGGRQPELLQSAAPTTLTFSNALRTFYGAIYRSSYSVKHEEAGSEYFVKKVHFKHHVSMFFQRNLFSPLVSGFYVIANRLQKIQSGNINLYNAIIWVLLLLALLSVFF